MFLISSWACSTSLDCSLNGDCIAGTCVCDPSWAGPKCQLLDVVSGSPSFGYHNASEASWGGVPILGPDGMYHMFVAQMANGCTLNDYGSNSFIARYAFVDKIRQLDSRIAFASQHHFVLSSVVSSRPEGPYSFVEVVIPVFAHNPTVRLLPDKSLVLFFIGDGNATGTQPLPKNCTHGASTTSLESPNRYHESTPWRVPMDQCGGLTVAHAPSVFGPWTVAPIEISNCAASPWIGYGRVHFFKYAKPP